MTKKKPGFKARLCAGLAVCMLLMPFFALPASAAGTEEPAPTVEQMPEPTQAPQPSAGGQIPFTGGKDYYPAIAGVAMEEFVMPSFDVSCCAAVLFEQETGTVLYEKEMDSRRPIASITKIMTVMLVMEALESGKISLDEIVPISEHAYSTGGSQIWLDPKDQMTVEELLKAVIISSANDAAVALAELVGGSEPVFCEMMNARAAQLGMENTHFVNACGLDAENHYSSARDVAIMASELLHAHPEVTQYTTVWIDYLRDGETQLLNTNRLLRSYQGIIGLKTGTTNGAGVCIAAVATRGESTFVAVVLGADSSAERFEDATTLLDFGFANYEMALTPSAENAPHSLPVRYGASEEVKLTYNVPDKVLLRKGEASGLTAVVDLPAELDAPVHAGSQVGTVKIMSGERVLGSYAICAQSDVESMTFSTALAFLTNALFAF